MNINRDIVCLYHFFLVPYKIKVKKEYDRTIFYCNQCEDWHKSFTDIVIYELSKKIKWNE